jgi:hypothetical protein
VLLAAFAWLTSAVEDLNPAFCGVDFDITFFRQVAIHLPGVDLIGCLFHWKQAIRRKIIKLGIPDDEVKFAIMRGVIDLLTIVPKDEVHPIGTTYIAAKIMDYCAEKKTSKAPLHSMQMNLTFPQMLECFLGRLLHSISVNQMSFPSMLFTHLSNSISFPVSGFRRNFWMSGISMTRKMGMPSCSI